MDLDMHTPLRSSIGDVHGVRALFALRANSLDPALGVVGNEAEHRFATTLDEVKKALEAPPSEDPPGGYCYGCRAPKRWRAPESRTGEGGATSASALDTLVEVYNRIEQSDDIHTIRANAAARRTMPESEVARYSTSYWVRAYYVAFPCMLFFSAFCVQSFLLHVATNLYVVYMTEEEREYQGPLRTYRLFHIIGNAVGAYT